MTDLLQAAAEAVELGKAATPGPWNWREARGSRRIDLAAPHGGGSVVMDFARNGMQGAEPRFAVCMDGQPRGRRGGILRSASELVKADPDGLLRHPDALLIAAAQGHVDLIRDLAAEVVRLRADAARLDWLSDPSQSIGNVILPTECVTLNLHSLRAAIDAAMMLAAARTGDSHER